MHQVITKSLLKLRAHEIVSRTRPRQDGKMYLEPEEVEEERDNDKSHGASGEVLAKSDKVQSPFLAVDVQQIPEVNKDSTTDGEEGEGSHVFRGDDAAHAETRQQQPFPPFSAERFMSLFVESDIAQDAQSHEENEGGVKKNQSSLSHM